jgi:peptide deformylase
MSILKVARMGHPVLRQVAHPVDPKEITNPAFQQFVQDMIETMREYNGLGLAAPQVHRSVRMCVVEVEENPRYKNKKLSGLIVFINPEIEHLTDEKDSYWEGCLSVPGMRGLVARTTHVRATKPRMPGTERQPTQ